MAKNWTIGEAFKAVLEGDKEGILDVGKRFPLSCVMLAKVNAEAAVIFDALPENMTVRKLESVLKGDIEVSDEDDANEDAPVVEKKEKKEKAEKKVGKRGRPAKKVAEPDDDEDFDDEDFDDEDEEDEDEEEVVVKPKKNKKEKEKKNKKPAKKPVVEDDDDDDDFDFDDDDE